MCLPDASAGTSDGVLKRRKNPAQAPLKTAWTREPRSGAVGFRLTRPAAHAGTLGEQLFILGPHLPSGPQTSANKANDSDNSQKRFLAHSVILHRYPPHSGCKHLGRKFLRLPSVLLLRFRSGFPVSLASWDEGFLLEARLWRGDLRDKASERASNKPQKNRIPNPEGRGSRPMEEVRFKGDRVEEGKGT